MLITGLQGTQIIVAYQQQISCLVLAVFVVGHLHPKKAHEPAQLQQQLLKVT